MAITPDEARTYFRREPTDEPVSLDDVLQKLHDMEFEAQQRAQSHDRGMTGLLCLIFGALVVIALKLFAVI